MSLFDRSLIVVTGKGGVGRTTIAAALGVAAARRGRRALVMELSGMAAVPPLFGLQGRAFALRRATDGVWVASLTVAECLEDFARRKLRLSSFVARLFHTAAVQTFVDAVPGLHDILQLGKIENLIREPLDGDPRFDVVIVDAPATGHGLTLLSAPRSMTEVAKAGPFHDLADNIRGFLADPAATAVAVVTLPEDLPVSETGELVRALDGEGIGAHTIIVNRCDADPLPGAPAELVAALRALPDGDGLADLAAQALARHAAQQRAIATLSTTCAAWPRVDLPRASERLPLILGAALAERL